MSKLSELRAKVQEAEGGFDFARGHNAFLTKHGQQLKGPIAFSEAKLELAEARLAVATYREEQAHERLIRLAGWYEQRNATSGDQETAKSLRHIIDAIWPKEELDKTSE